MLRCSCSMIDTNVYLLFVHARTVPAPHVPASTSMSDASNYEQEDYEVAALNDTPPSSADQLLFADFSGDTGDAAPAPADQYLDEPLPDDL